MKSLFTGRFTAFLSATALTAAGLISMPAIGDWTVDDGGLSSYGVPQDVVISPKQNPRSKAEATCLSVTLARSLRGDFSPPEAPPSNANVTLFPTLEGVRLGNARVVSRKRIKCTTPEGVISLQENLEDFLCDDGDRDVCPDGLNMNNMVICPICWAERYGDAMPDYGVLNPAAVGKVLLDAEKVFDF